MSSMSETVAETVRSAADKAERRIETASCSDSTEILNLDCPDGVPKSRVPKHVYLPPRSTALKFNWARSEKSGAF